MQVWQYEDNRHDVQEGNYVIAIDVDDMEALQRRLREAAADVARAVPTLPGSSAYGPAVLGGAVASFEAAMRRQAQDLNERWNALESGIAATLSDAEQLEDHIVTILSRAQGALS